MKKGSKHSKETIEKIRKANIGRKFSKESIERMSKASMGKKGTYGHLGKKHNDATKKKISEAKKGSRHSEATKEKMRQSAKRGSLSCSWRGGITPENKKIRNSIEYREWRIAVFKRDNYECIWCGVSGSKKYLNADHIKPFCRFPELRLKISNGRTLCVECHSKTDSYKGRVIKNYKLT